MSNIENIVRGCVENNKESQLEFYSLYSKDIYCVIFRIIQDCDETKDIMQNSFLKVFKRIDTYHNKPEAIIYSLKRIAINASIDYIRRKKIHFIDNIENIPDVVDEVIDEENNILKVEKIKKAMSFLPSGVRTILTLRIIEEFSFEEIAQELDMRASTVRTQYVRGRSKILSIIENEKI